MSWWVWLVIGVAIFLVAVIAYDLLQRRHALLRNFPIIGHFRYLLEATAGYVIVKQSPFPVRVEHELRIARGRRDRVAQALGCDTINVGREAMLAIG